MKKISHYLVTAQFRHGRNDVVFLNRKAAMQEFAAACDRYPNSTVTLDAIDEDGEEHRMDTRESPEEHAAACERMGNRMTYGAAKLEGYLEDEGKRLIAAHRCGYPDGQRWIVVAEQEGAVQPFVCWIASVSPRGVSLEAGHYCASLAAALKKQQERIALFDARVAGQTPQDRYRAIVAALQVMTLDPKIAEWLRENDPKALEQAEDALTGV